MNCSLPGSSVHGVFQVRILEWVAISFSRGSSPPRGWTHISFIGRQIFYHWATGEAPEVVKAKDKNSVWKVFKECRTFFFLREKKSKIVILYWGSCLRVGLKVVQEWERGQWRTKAWMDLESCKESVKSCKGSNRGKKRTENHFMWSSWLRLN